MPMDIRSFFAKKPEAGGSNKAPTSNNTEKQAATAAGAGATAAPPPPASRSKKTKIDNAAKVVNSTCTTTKPAVLASTKPVVSKKEERRKQNEDKKMKGFESSSSSEEEESYSKPSPQKKLKSTTATTTKKPEVEEISASDYFSQTAAGKAKKPATAPAPAEETTTKVSPKKSKSSSPPPKKKSSPAKKRIRDDDDEEEEEEDDVYVPSASESGDEELVEDHHHHHSPPKRSSPAKRAATKTPSPSVTKTPTASWSSSSPKRSKTPDTTKKTPILQPSLERDSFDVDKDAVVPECLAGLTFVLTGILENLGRDDTSDLIKTLGGRVTTSVSGKTSFLVVGHVLEDGRDAKEGKKYQAALEKKIPMVIGESKLYGLCHLYQNLKKKQAGIPEDQKVPSSSSSSAAAASTTSSAKPVAPGTASASTVPPLKAGAPKVNPYVNPYAKKPANNPYAMKPAASGGTAPAAAASNPYAKAANPYSKGGGAAVAATTPTATSSANNNNNNSTLNQLWVDRHAPTSTRDILGNKDNVQKLATWLNSWERTFNNPKSYNKAFSNPKGPWKAALLSGPPGIGKTTTATLVAKEAGRDLREFNASDARSKKALQEQLGDLTGSQSLGFQIAGSKPKPSSSQKTLRCIIMDEVDGMGAGDRSGMAELIQMIKKSKVPIICICNDRQSQKMKSLLPYCMDLRFKRPTKNIMANRAVRIAEMEGLSVERNAAEAIAESCGNDVRQVLNVLQMWAQKKGTGDDSLTFKNLKERENSINKDEILRVSLFDAAKTIMEGRRGLSGADAKTQVDSLFRRSDAFFVDYSFTGLLVQQNYPRVMQSQYGLVKKADNPVAEMIFLNRMHDAAASMSDYAMIEHNIRSGDQNWSLLPATAMMAVKTGFHAGGKAGGMLPGYPEFTAWMGKNSSKNKKQRILNELHHHMNFKISADSQQLRESYLPVFRERFLNYFQGSDRSDEANDAIIELMDEYGLSREDVMEKLDEFQLAQKGESSSSFADLDSKQKAAFTRRYNQGSHKSQALVDEEFGTTKPKKSGGKRERDPHDLDAIDEDGDVEEEESEGEDEEAEMRKLQEKLKKKGRKPAPGAGKANKAPAKKGKKT